MTEQPLPLPQTQNRDLRLGRLEGLAEQFVEQSRETNVRLGRMEQTIAEQGSRIDEQGRELRQAIAEQGNRIDAQGSELRQEIAAQGRRIDAQGRRIETLTRWLVGMQIASLVALGTLILVRLP